MENQNNDSGEMQQDESYHILKALYAEEFGGEIDALALALGVDADEIQRMLNRDEPINDDLEMKIRGIAQERNVEI